jgi:hypothetical protein
VAIAGSPVLAGIAAAAETGPTGFDVPVPEPAAFDAVTTTRS